MNKLKIIFGLFIGVFIIFFTIANEGNAADCPDPGDVCVGVDYYCPGDGKIIHLEGTKSPAWFPADTSAFYSKNF